MRVRVVVSPAARREHFEELKPNTFAISVREKAERNEANERVRALLARHFRVPVSFVRFVSGVRGKVKTFNVIK